MKQLKSPTLHPEVLLYWTYANYGGAIYVYSYNSLLTISGSSFNSCSVSVPDHGPSDTAVYHFYEFFGGTIYTRTLNITSTHFTECATKLLASSGSTDHYGTVIYASDVTASDLQIRWMHFAL